MRHATEAGHCRPQGAEPGDHSLRPAGTAGDQGVPRRHRQAGPFPAQKARRVLALMCSSWTASHGWRSRTVRGARLITVGRPWNGTPMRSSPLTS